MSGIIGQLTPCSSSVSVRCFLAVLETSLTLTIRSTEKDYIQGAWLDVSHFQGDSPVGH